MWSVLLGFSTSLTFRLERPLSASSDGEDLPGIWVPALPPMPETLVLLALGVPVPMKSADLALAL